MYVCMERVQGLFYDHINHIQVNLGSSHSCWPWILDPSQGVCHFFSCLIYFEEIQLLGCNDRYFLQCFSLGSK